MKKILIVMATGALVFGVGAAPSHAVNCNAFNQGTFRAAHINGVTSPGIYKIAMACHG